MSRATGEQRRLVLDAAERHARELLNQASKYERLGQPTVAKLTLNEHYRPLREAISAVEGEPC